MLYKRSLSALSSAERQLLRQQRLSSGQCVRCFHASLRQHAEGDGSAGSGQRNQGSEEGNDQGTPYNKPQRGPTRHQRAAMISEEVRMLNRDTPNLGPSKPPNDSADFAAPPAPTGPGAPPGRMGENMPPQREGPLAQGMASPTRKYTNDEMGDMQKGNMNVRGDSAGDVLGGQTRREEASVSIKRAQDPEEEDEEEGEGEEEDDTEVPDMITRRSRRARKAATPSGSSLPLPGVPFQPSELDAKGLTSSGSNHSTIAAKSFEQTINDRLKLITEPGQDPVYRNVPYLARKILNSQLVWFRDQDEKLAVYEECRRMTGRGMKMTAQERAGKGEDDHPFFQSLPENVRKNIVDTMVNGSYDKDGVLEGKAKYKQPVLNEIAKMTMKNGTYLSNDGDRLLNKVRSLLPATQAPQQKAGGQRQQQARK